MWRRPWANVVQRQWQTRLARRSSSSGVIITFWSPKLVDCCEMSGELHGGARACASN